MHVDGCCSNTLPSGGTGAANPGTPSLAGGSIAAADLTKWYETRIKLKWDSLDTHAAVFAWDSRAEQETARVDFKLPPDFRLPASGGTLLFSLSQAGIQTLPDDWEDQVDDRQASSNAAARDDKRKDVSLDWTIVVRDGDGVEAELPLSHDLALYPLVQAVPRRASFLDDNDPTEILFRSYEFPLEAFAAANPSFDATRIAMISFVFDGPESGAIMLDHISIRAGSL